MKSKDNSSILISIFKRKGGEGECTKILNDSNSENYKQLLIELETNEKELILHYKNKLNWLLLTNKHIWFCKSGLKSKIMNEDIMNVSPALKEEFKDKIMSKNKFTRLNLTDKYLKNHILILEKGQPYEGVYQVLHFLATKNN